MCSASRLIRRRASLVSGLAALERRVGGVAMKCLSRGMAPGRPIRGRAVSAWPGGCHWADDRGSRDPEGPSAWGRPGGRRARRPADLRRWRGLGPGRARWDRLSRSVPRRFLSGLPHDLQPRAVA